MKKITTILLVMLSITSSYSQSIKDLDFFIGTWEVREDNTEREWWETATRVGKYVLKGNFIELKAESIDSNGRKREYSWYFHYNRKEKQFEMTSMFSNWHKVQSDILEWDAKSRTLTIRNNPAVSKFPIRYGKMVFSKDFKSYVWKGENKSGDPSNPSIWRYIEKGKRTK